MEEKILKEIKELKSLLAQLIGSSELPVKQQFSKEAITKAATEFQKLSIERGEWVTENEISSIIKKAPSYSGKFIIEKFEFTNYFKRGRSLYFNKKELMALNTELKKRNINLKRYMELIEDQEKFKKFLDEVKNPKAIKKRPRFKIPEELKDIETYPYHHPPKEIVKQHIETLMEEFNKYKMVEYVDIYNGNHAMFKFIYYFDKYVNPEVKKRCQNWCTHFNYAQNALKEISKIRSEVVYD